MAGRFSGWGRGRAWPLLTGERGHYELAAGRDPRPTSGPWKRFADGGLLSEQVWDAADRPDDRLWLGRPTGAAMPLVWAHAEYLTLVRSVADGRVFDLLAERGERYQSDRPRRNLEIWKPNRHVRPRSPPRARCGFRPRPTSCCTGRADEWRHSRDTPATPTGSGRPLRRHSDLAARQRCRCGSPSTGRRPVAGRVGIMQFVSGRIVAPRAGLAPSVWPW